MSTVLCGGVPQSRMRTTPTAKRSTNTATSMRLRWRRSASGAAGDDSGAGAKRGSDMGVTLGSVPAGRGAASVCPETGPKASAATKEARGTAV